MLAVAVAALLVVAAPALADHLTGLRIQNGTNGDDVLIGTNRGDGLFGKGGDDVIQGRGAGDFLDGDSNDRNTVRGSGQDTIQGGNGPDDIYGGPDEDTLSGDSGDDEISDGRYNGTEPTNGDGAVDTIKCGDGRDTVAAERRDIVANDCERVTYRN